MQIVTIHDSEKETLTVAKQQRKIAALQKPPTKKELEKAWNDFQQHGPQSGSVQAVLEIILKEFVKARKN